jgi:hypothetical protein
MKKHEMTEHEKGNLSKKESLYKSETITRNKELNKPKILQKYRLVSIQCSRCMDISKHDFHINNIVNMKKNKTSKKQIFIKINPINMRKTNISIKMTPKIKLMEYKKINKVIYKKNKPPKLKEIDIKIKTFVVNKSMKRKKSYLVKGIISKKISLLKLKKKIKLEVAKLIQGNQSLRKRMNKIKKAINGNTKNIKIIVLTQVSHFLNYYTHKTINSTHSLYSPIY